MTKYYSRRRILKSSAVGSFSGVVISGASVQLAAGDQEGSIPGNDPELFRLINSGFDRSKTTVEVLDPVGVVVQTYNLETIGTNHPDMQDKSHEERFPHIAKDIDSFGDLSPGKYTLRVNNNDLQGQTIFVVAENGQLIDETVLGARILPDDQLKVSNYYRDY